MTCQKGYYHLTAEDKGRILAFHQTSLSIRNIALQINRSKNCVHAFLSHRESTQDTPAVETRGRKRKTDEKTDRHIILTVKRQRFTTARDIIRTVEGASNLCENTIRHRIKESKEFKSYWAARKPYISETNRVKRLEWAHEHINWSNEQWDQVLWSDESPFVLRYKCRVRVWRMHNERYATHTTKATVKHDSKIMVWGCFTSHGVGQLGWIEGIMDQHLYKEVLHDWMLPSKDTLFRRRPWIFQQDNYPKHTAKTIRAYIKAKKIPTLP